MFDKNTSTITVIALRRVQGAQLDISGSKGHSAAADASVTLGVEHGTQNGGQRDEILLAESVSISLSFSIGAYGQIGRAHV